MLPSRDGALWDCACECALRRIVYHDCKHKFDSDACNRCDVYIKHYGDFSPTDARLYMMEAGKFAYMNKEDKITRWLCASIIIGFFAFVVHAWITVDARIEQNRVAAGLAAPAKTINYKQEDQRDNIKDALLYTKDKLSAHTDVNKDGLVNCIDAAVLFYGRYPDKSKVAIESNFHPDGKMQHLFNVVLVNGVWRAVEPQAYWKGHASYWMKDLWGDAYDNRYNVDETERYRGYVK